MKYKILRTDKADELIHNIILFVAEKFGADVALEKLDKLEADIMLLAGNPNLGEIPRNSVLKRQGYRVLVLEKDLVFYKVDEENHTVIVYAVVDQRQDYLSIIRGL
ncbi:MAG: type II toxin-antitoxin system RelE/ParE family toxin [Lachnospiraceae bacterium]|nr:type II toxin-antitoxin system RelE/ParE family toxin [Lachnospiraceae bacterium]